MSDPNKLRSITHRQAAGCTGGGARHVPAERVACPRAVAAEVRATVASVLTSRRGTVYRFGSLVVAFNGAGAFYGVGVEYHGGIQFAPARAKGAQW